MSYFGEENEYKCTLLELFMQNWVDKPLSVVFDLYSNFVVEERHGFNKMSIGFCITDMVKTECLTYAFAGPIVPAIIWIVRAGGETFYLYVWAFLQALIFVFLWIFPNFIQPMFNKYTDLTDDAQSR